MSAQLASFLLYSLSPFHPNPDILENKDLLTELTKQYKVRPGWKSLSSLNSKVLEARKNPAGLQRLLRSAAPTCSEVSSNTDGFPARELFSSGDPGVPACISANPSRPRLLQHVLQEVPISAGRKVKVFYSADDQYS